MIKKVKVKTTFIAKRFHTNNLRTRTKLPIRIIIFILGSFNKKKRLANIHHQNVSDN